MKRRDIRNFQVLISICIDLYSCCSTSTIDGISSRRADDKEDIGNDGSSPQSGCFNTRCSAFRRPQFPIPGNGVIRAFSLILDPYIITTVHRTNILPLSRSFYFQLSLAVLFTVVIPLSFFAIAAHYYNVFRSSFLFGASRPSLCSACATRYNAL